MPYKDIYGVLYIALNKKVHRLMISLFAVICILMQVVTILGIYNSVEKKVEDEEAVEVLLSNICRD